MEIETFEDIKAWQEARVLVRMVYEAVKSAKGSSIQYLLSKDKQPKNPINSINSNV